MQLNHSFKSIIESPTHIKYVFFSSPFIPLRIFNLKAIQIFSSPKNSKFTLFFFSYNIYLKNSKIA